jgi:solute carrier family 25 carnitine/acylcarnitine transporter 20/29
MVDCISKTWQHEGLGGFYKGAAMPLAAALAQNAAIFGVFDLAMSFATPPEDKSAGRPPSLRTTAVAAAITGFSLALIESPTELVKCKMQAQIGRTGGAFPGSMSAAAHVLKHHGLRGMFQGFAATALRSTSAKALYFTSFAAVSDAITPDGAEPSLPACFVAGGVAGGAAWSLNYPIDVVKSRIQTDALDPSRRRYSGTADCFQQVLRAEGALGLFKVRGRGRGRGSERE